MEVGVKVFAEDLRTAVTRHVASAYLTFVALDEQRRPLPVPPVIPESDDEKRRYEEAGQRREYRLALLRKRENAAQPSSSSPSPSAL
jgi:acyl-CoA hydrolase